MYIARMQEKDIRESLAHFPVTAIIGPRQCGKSTLAKEILKNAKDGVYLDLERPSHLARLENAELYLTAQRGKLVCIDEIQRMPGLFPLLRSLSDEWGQTGAFLILGSASRDLLKQSSETLAGRIAYHHLSPFLWDEISGRATLPEYIASGGFPGSVLAASPKLSLRWRENFIATFIERDIPQWFGAPPASLRRLWAMLAHGNGGTANYSRLGGALGVSDNTVRNHIEMLTGTFMADAVAPYHSNLGKRMAKAPKVYLTDSGITAAMLGLGTYDDIIGHPGFGALWEQIVLTNIKGHFPSARICHYRSASGAEIDFVVCVGGRTIAVECKASASPALSKGNHSAIGDICPDRSFIVAPVREGWPYAQGIDVLPLDGIASLCAYGAKTANTP